MKRLLIHLPLRMRYFVIFIILAFHSLFKPKDYEYFLADLETGQNSRLNKDYINRVFSQTQTRNNSGD